MIYNHDGYILHKAQQSDLPYLLQFQKTFFEYEETKKSEILFYHIENDPFSEADFEKIISRQEIVIAEKEKEIIGYVLIDNCSATKCLQDHRRYIAHFLEEEYLDPAEQMAPRLAELINPVHNNEELKQYLFSILIEVTKDKYDALFCNVCMNTEVLLEKLKLGWKIVFDNGMYYFLHWENKPENANE